MQIEITKQVKVDLMSGEYASPGDRYHGVKICGADNRARICGGHGIYAYIEPDAYVIIRERRVEYRVDPVSREEIK